MSSTSRVEVPRHAQLERWRHAGLLETEDPAEAARRVRVLEALSELGISEEAMRDASARGRLEDAIFRDPLRAATRRPSLSTEQVCEMSGLSLAEVRELWQALGLSLPPPEEPYFTWDEADVLGELGRLREIWPAGVYLQLARVYGQALAHIAETELRLFRLHVAEPQARRLPLAEALAVARRAFEELLPLAPPMILSVHRRWLEQRIAQAGVQALEARVGERDVPDAVEVTLLFVDLKDFVAYAEELGDVAAAAAIGEFAQIVSAEHGERGHVVKAIGDGYFLVYDEVGAAVAAARRILTATAQHEMPAAHAAVHHGVAVFREGDFFGRNVNLAARLLPLAGPHELLATRAVATAEPGVAWEPLGPRRFRGFREPVPVFRLRPGAGAAGG